MEKQIIDAEKIKKNGWKQGACLLVKNTSKIKMFRHEQILEQGCYVIISQNCDIIQSNLAKEPLVELILAENIDSCKNEFTLGKNPRQLQLELAEHEINLNFLSHQKYSIDRSYLEDLQSEKIEVNGKALKILINWLCKRYRRPAFPDEFNRRIEKEHIKKIKNKLNEVGEYSLGLFIRLATEKELTKDEIYYVTVIMLVEKEGCQDQQKFSVVQKRFDQILNILDEIKSIKIIEGSQVISTDEITLDEYENYKSLDLDYLSYMNDKNGKVIDDMIH